MSEHASSGVEALADHVKNYTEAKAVVVVDGSADDIIARMVAAGWTLEDRADQVAGKRIRFLVPPSAIPVPGCEQTWDNRGRGAPCPEVPRWLATATCGCDHRRSLCVCQPCRDSLEAAVPSPPGINCDFCFNADEGRHLCRILRVEFTSLIPDSRRPGIQE